MLENILLTWDNQSVNLYFNKEQKENDIFVAIKRELNLFYYRQHIDELITDNSLADELRGYATYKIQPVGFDSSYYIKSETKSWKYKLSGFFLNNKQLNERSIGSVNLYKNDSFKQKLQLYNLHFYILSIDDVNSSKENLKPDIGTSIRHAERFYGFIENRMTLGEEKLIYLINLETQKDLGFLEKGDDGIFLRRLFNINSAIYYPFVFVLDNKIINQVSKNHTYSIMRGNEKDEIDFICRSITKYKEIDYTLNKLAPISNVRAIIFLKGEPIIPKIKNNLDINIISKDMYL